MAKLKEYEVEYEYSPHAGDVMIVEATTKLQAKKKAEEELARTSPNARIGNVYVLKDQSKAKQSEIEHGLRVDLSLAKGRIRALEGKLAKIFSLAEI